MIYTRQEFLEYGKLNVHHIRKSPALMTTDPDTGGTD